MEKKKAKKRRRSGDSSFLPAKKPRTQETIQEAFDSVNISQKKEKAERAKKLELEQQLRVDMRIFQYVVGTCQPLSTVENILFRNVCTEIDSRVNVVCTKTLKKTIVKEYLQVKTRLRERFRNAVDVCLTADVWGSKHRSFLGVTAHWIETVDGVIQRHSCALACKRFTGKVLILFLIFLIYRSNLFCIQGSHTYDKIASLINQIMDDFNLHGKVTFIVTDNGSNFVKAFKEFAVISLFAKNYIDTFIDIFV